MSDSMYPCMHASARTHTPPRWISDYRVTLAMGLLIRSQCPVSQHLYTSSTPVEFFPLRGYKWGGIHPLKKKKSLHLTMWRVRLLGWESIEMLTLNQVWLVIYFSLGVFFYLFGVFIFIFWRSKNVWLFCLGCLFAFCFILFSIIESYFHVLIVVFIVFFFFFCI